MPQGTTRITLHVDDEVLDWFREQVNGAGGGNYGKLINKVLRDYVARGGEDAATPAGGTPALHVDAVTTPPARPS